MGCGCDGGPIIAGPAHVFTARDATNFTNIWLTAPMAGPAYTKLSVRYYIGPISGNMGVKLVYGHGSDIFGLTAVQFGTERTSTGWYTEYIDTVVSGIYYQFGVAVRNSGSASNAESALIQHITFTPSTC